MKTDDFKLGKPKHVGEFQTRAEPRLVEPAEGEDVGWTCQCLAGIEVFYAPDPLPTERDEFIAALGDPVRDPNLPAGTVVVFQSLFGGFVRATVEVDEVDGRRYADSGGSIYILSWDQDDRHCWTSSYGINKKAIRRE